MGSKILLLNGIVSLIYGHYVTVTSSNNNTLIVTKYLLINDAILFNIESEVTTIERWNCFDLKDEKKQQATDAIFMRTFS